MTFDRSSATRFTAGLRVGRGGGGQGGEAEEDAWLRDNLLSYLVEVREESSR